MTAAEIIQIIEASSKHQVTRFRAGDIEVTFSGYREPVSQLAALSEQDRQTKEWLEQIIPPPPPEDTI